MIDYGLLFSMIVGLGLPAFVMNWWPLSSHKDSVGFTDVALGPAFAGLAVGRLVALAIDDPSSIGSISDMLIIRSGVEFWPGVGAACALLVVGAKRAGFGSLTRVADITALSVVSYAGYEAACLFRDGCFGPESSVGLVPPGLGARMLPIGLFMAAGAAVAAVGLRRLSRNGASDAVVVLAGVASVAAVRAAGSVWLPHVGGGLTRQHLTSIGVLAAAVTGLVVIGQLARQANGSVVQSV